MFVSKTFKLRAHKVTLQDGSQAAVVLSCLCPRFHFFKHEYL